MRIQKPAKTAAVIGAGLLVLLLAALLGLQLFLGTQTAGGMLRKRINAGIPGRISWQDQEISVLRGKVDIGGLVLLDPDGRSVLTAAHVSLNAGVLDFLAGSLRIRSAHVAAPRVFLRTTDSGGLNLMRVFSAPAAESRRPAPDRGEAARGTGLPVQIKKLRVSRGHFSYAASPESGAGRIHMADVELLLEDADIGQRSGHLEMSAKGGQVAMAGCGRPVDHFHLEAALNKGRIAPLEMDLVSGSSRLHLGGSAAGIFAEPQPESGPNPELDLALSVSTELCELREILGWQTPLAGPVTLQVKARGPIRNPELSVRAACGPGRVGDTGMEKIVMQCRMRDRQLRLNRLEAVLEAAKVRARGTMDLRAVFADGFPVPAADPGAVTYTLSVESSGTRINALPGIGEAVSGAVDARIQLRGSGIREEELKAGGHAVLEGREFFAEGMLQPIDFRISTRAEVAGSLVSLRELLIQIPGGELRGKGSYDWRSGSMHWSGNAGIASLAELMRPLPLPAVSGRASMKAEISGPIDTPAADVRIRGEGLSWRGFGFGSLEGDLAFGDETLAIRGLSLENGDSRLTASGSVTWPAENDGSVLKQPVYALSVPESRLYLQDFLPKARGGLDVSGRVSGTGKDLSGRLEIAGHDLSAAGQSIFAMRLGCRLDGQRIHLSPLAVSPAPGEKLRVEGWLGLDGRYDLAMSADPLRLSSISMLQARGIGGRLELSASGAGNLSAPRASGWIRLSGLSAEGISLPDIRVAAELHEGILRAETSEPLAGSLRLDLSSRQLSASARLSDMELAPFLQVAGGADMAEDISGSVSASLKADGNLRRLQDFRAHCNITSLVLNFRDTELLRASELRAVFAGGKLKLPDSRVHLMQKGFLDLRGELAPAGEIQAAASGSIPAAIVQGLIPGVQKARGGVELALEVGGTIGRPEVAADMAFVDLAVTAAETLQELHGINGRIHFTNEAVTVHALSGHLDQGDFRLSGKISLESFMPRQADLRFAASALPLVIPEFMEMQVSTQLHLSGKKEKYRLSGDVELLEGRYFRDFHLSLLDAARDIGGRERGSEAGRARSGLDIPLIPGLAIDIGVSSRRPVTVENNMALLHIRPTLRIQGTAEQPVVTGRAEVRRGTLTYRNTDFAVEKGLIDFVNPYRIEPAMDIRAEARVRRWEITLAVRGTPQNLEFHLSSDPEEEDGDILSLLAVGKTTRELASGSGGSSRPPAEMLADLVGDRLEKQVQEGTGLDIVEMEYRKGETEAESPEEVRVTVGKELSRRLMVKYGVERRGGSMIQKSTALYKLLENLSVNAYQDTEGAFGGEMRYRLEFR